MPGPRTVTMCRSGSTLNVKRLSQLKSLNGAMSWARISSGVR
jgi:hypothetical protein